jgi:hypothetical protein
MKYYKDLEIKHLSNLKTRDFHFADDELNSIAYIKVAR